MCTYIPSTWNMLDIVLGATSGGDMAEIQLFVDDLNLNTAQTTHCLKFFYCYTCKQTDTKCHWKHKIIMFNIQWTVYDRTTHLFVKN